MSFQIKKIMPPTKSDLANVIINELNRLHPEEFREPLIVTMDVVDGKIKTRFSIPHIFPMGVYEGIGELHMYLPVSGSVHFGQALNIQSMDLEGPSERSFQEAQKYVHSLLKTNRVEGHGTRLPYQRPTHAVVKNNQGRMVLQRTRYTS